MKHAVNWFEIPVLDFDRARSFYEFIFNYKMSIPVNEANIKMGLLPAEPDAVNGSIVWHTDFYKPSAEAGPLLYLNGNPDLNSIQERIVAGGGKLLIAKRQVSQQFGYMAVFMDSEGNRLALHSDH